MTPAYCLPETLAEALGAAREAGAVLLGGGTVAYPALALGKVAPAAVVDLARLRGGTDLAAEDGHVRIGALVTYAAYLRAPGLPAPALLVQICRKITGGPQLRNQGTIGGSACHANPASDMPTGLLATGARFRLHSQDRGARTIAAAEFFMGAFQTARAPDEVLTEILVPTERDGDHWGYYKLKFAEGGWPIAVAAARISRLPGSASGTLRLTIGAATDRPACLPLIALSSLPDLAAAERQAIAHAVDRVPAPWWSDNFADAAYRRRVAPVIALRAVEDALERMPA